MSSFLIAYFFSESDALYDVSASDEFPASPGLADGGRIPLLAAESGEELDTESFFTVVEEVSLQDPRIMAAAAKSVRAVFFIKRIFPAFLNYQF